MTTQTMRTGSLFAPLRFAVRCGERLRTAWRARHASESWRRVAAALQARVPRATVGRKVVAGLIVIVALGMLSMLLIYRGLNIVEKDVNRLADIEGPLTAAAYEMEVNVNGIGLAVLNYLATGGTEYRAWVDEDDIDFNNYHATYERLVGSDREEELAEEIAEHYARFIALGRSVMGRHDEQERMFADVAAAIEEIDRIIDLDMPQALPSAAASSGEVHAKELALADMEAEAAEIGFWLAIYRRAHSAQARDKVFEKMRVFESELGRFMDRRLATRERALAETLRQTYARVAGPIRSVVALEDTIQQQRETFIGLRYRMDRLLDHEIQVLLADGLDKPRREANAAADQVIDTMRFLIPLFVLIAALIGWLLVRGLRRSLLELRRGAEAVGRGDLEHRIAARGRDELAELARDFNRMVMQLRETTVSKDVLEESEQKLRHTVADLRHQITERERAERDREGLQSKLRRTETMSAMGALVAGVAHEVRNPLFGISSTLDAMDARFSERPEYARYREVLRGEVDRLGKLMSELLHFGKPCAEQMAPGRLEDVIALAVKSASVLAARREVSVQVHMPAHSAPIRMARNRMMQAFLNLIENSVQHSPRGSAVRIDAEEVSASGRRWVDCTVRDSGSGIRAEDLGKLFEPFFTRRRGGTGLGLSIVQRVVEEHGGRVCARNHPEGGAQMTVRLPLE